MIRAGIIGSGGISRVHLEILKKHSDVVVAAICDIDRSAAEQKAEQFGGNVYEDFEVMLEKADLDAVWLCTPPHIRRGPLFACADRNIPVFCEKPVAFQIDEAKTIASGLKKRQAKVQVGYPFRALPIVQKIKSLIESDRIWAIQSTYLCNVSISMALAPWFYIKEKSGGAIVDQATHMLDLIRYLIGEVSGISGLASNPVKQKQKDYTIDEVIGFAFACDSGATGTHIHSWVSDTWRVNIFFSGERGFYNLDLTRGILTVSNGDGEKTFNNGGVRTHSPENVIFLDMFRNSDWSANPCTFEDAVKTLELTVDVNRAIDSSSPD